MIGIPSERWGEQVHAIVVLRTGAKSTPDELIEFCKTLIAGYKCPRSVECHARLRCRCPAPARSSSANCASRTGKTASAGELTSGTCPSGGRER